MDDSVKCARGVPPVVRLGLVKVKCPRGSASAVSTPEGIVKYVQREYGCQPQEYLLVVGFDVRMTPLVIVEVSVGGMSQALGDPKVAFSALLLAGSSMFLLFHNHPSGDGTPSQQDIDLTKRFKMAGEVLAIRLVDHIIVTGGSHTSFQARGLLQRL